MLKKTIILAVAIAIAVSPLLPRVFADSGAWDPILANAAWDYDSYRVERLALDSNIEGPYQFNDALFVVKTSESCEYPTTCETVDMTMFKDGEELEIVDVTNRVTEAFWHTAQDGRFIYMVPTDAESAWGTVYEYDTVNGAVATLTDLTRASNSLAFMTLAIDGDRIYTSTLQKDKVDGDVESSLSVYDLESKFARNDFTYQLTAPWQEIVDVYDEVSLVRFQFEGDFEQLWLVNERARSMQAIPDSWTQPGADILGAHFLSDGSISYFRNFRLWRYMPGTDATPVDAGGAFLSWLVQPQDAIQIIGDRMAYIDNENGLYLSDTTGTRKMGVATNGVFNLTSEALYFQNLEGEYVGYDFVEKSFEIRNYHVTDSHDDILVGVDEVGDVWYENTTNGYLLNVGYGGIPMLSDREHAYWRGVDGNIYEATFSPLLDLERPDVEAFGAYGSTAVYLVSGNDMWLIPSPEVYHTWFDSWDDIVKVSPATLKAYLKVSDFKGDLKFAAGTRVKTTTSPRVYVVGSDYKLHWITTETVANEIYGADWNKGIVSVNDTYLWKYANGADVDSGDDVRTI
jgi:hypothetical protein